MKKKAIAILLVLMMAISLVGCSPAEIGYLNLSKEVAQMEGIKVDETIVINYTGDELKELTGMNIGNYLEIRATGVFNEKELAYDLELSYRLSQNDVFQPLTRIVMDKKAMLMSTEGLWKLAAKYGAEQFSPEFIQEVNAYVAANPFVRVPMEEALAVSMDYSSLMTESMKSLDILVKYHDGYSTGIITEADGGYTIRLDAESLVALIDGWLDYLQKDVDNSYSMVQAFAAWLEELSGEDMEMNLTKTQWQDGLKEAASQWQSLKAELKDMKLSDKDYYEAHTKMTGNKGSRVVMAEEMLNIEELGLNMQVKATSTEQKVAVSTALNATSIENFTAGLEEIVNRYTVVTGVEITPVDEETAEYVTHVSFCGHPSQNVGYGDLKYIDQKYSIVADDAANILPGLGVMVNGTQVSLSYNGQSAVVTGVLSEDLIGHEKVFIAVRDLAQVGIDVSYSANPEVLTLSAK